MRATYADLLACSGAFSSSGVPETIAGTDEATGMSQSVPHEIDRAGGVPRGDVARAGVADHHSAGMFFLQRWA